MINAITLKNLTIKNGNNTLINNGNINILKGSINYLIGTNGSGKTTLLKTILGIENNTGIIKIFDEKNSQSNVAKYINYLPQYSNIDKTFPITVYEMIKISCTKGNKCPLSVIGHLKEFNAEKLINKKIKELSGGEFQKAMIARALIGDKPILILDEPLNNLDHKSEQNLINLLRKLNKEKGKTILITTHDLSIIDEENSYCISLSHGEILYGKSKEILLKHKLEKI